MNRIIRLAIAAASALTLAVTVSEADAQVLRLRGYGDPRIDGMVRTAIANRTLFLQRDTLIKASDTIRGNVVVVKSRFVLEGTVIGDLTGFQANIYLRPPAGVTGQVLNVVGGLYPSELAKTGSIEDYPVAPYEVVSTDSGFVIAGKTKRPALSLLGGTTMPEYNRVDGLRVEVGPSVLLPPIAGVEPIVSASVGYATERKDVLERVQLMLKRGRSSVATGWENDITLTNDAWIRSGFKNSIAMFVNGKDYRNYYGADRTYVEFRRILERGARTSQYWMRGQNEIARPLAAGDPFAIFAPDSVRSNPLVPDSRVASGIVGMQAQWTGLTSLYDVKGTLEFAGKNGRGANTVFNAYTAQVDYAMKAIANHTLHVEAFFRGPLLGTDELPLQRWTFVGGSNTLYTYPVGHFPGDRLAFFETDYHIPLGPRIKVRFLGSPTIRLMHNIGMAWSRDINPGFEQNVGLRLQFPFVYARVVTDPARVSDKVLLDFGVSLPAKAYPWNKPPAKTRTKPAP